MPRGGKREKAGRKSTWASGRTVKQTTLIRVPTEFSEQLLDIAHKLDAGKFSDLVTKSEIKYLHRLEEEFLDLVTEPKTSSQQKEVLNEAEQLELLKNVSNSTNLVCFLSSVELAKRLNTNPSTISKHKLGKRKPSLVEWTKKKDPEGIAWEYCQETKKYKPVN